MALSLEAYSQRDKRQHFTVGFTVGGITSILVKNPRKAITTSLVATTGLGFAKELSDQRFDPRDFQATVLGGLAGSATVLLIRKIKKHRK